MKEINLITEFTQSLKAFPNMYSPILLERESVQWRSQKPLDDGHKGQKRHHAYPNTGTQLTHISKAPLQGGVAMVLHESCSGQWKMSRMDTHQSQVCILKPRAILHELLPSQLAQLLGPS